MTTDSAETGRHAEPNTQSVDPGKRRMIWLDMNDPDGAYAALMRLVDESASRGKNDYGDTMQPDHHEP